MELFVNKENFIIYLNNKIQECKKQKFSEEYQKNKTKLQELNDNFEKNYTNEYQQNDLELDLEFINLKKTLMKQYYLMVIENNNPNVKNFLAYYYQNLEKN